MFNSLGWTIFVISIYHLVFTVVWTIALIYEKNLIYIIGIIMSVFYLLKSIKALFFGNAYDKYILYE